MENDIFKIKINQRFEKANKFELVYFVTKNKLKLDHYSNVCRLKHISSE